MERCSNCGYEVEETNEPTGMCQTCWWAYDKGYNKGYEEGRNK
jgi:hypothetical protein